MVNERRARVVLLNDAHPFPKFKATAIDTFRTAIAKNSLVTDLASYL